MVRFLKRVDLITARDGLTVEYLASLGVTANVVRVWDPAFALVPEVYSGPEAQFVQEGCTVGFNLSALVARWWTGGSLQELLQGIAHFLRSLLSDGIRVLLVPHVDKPEGSIEERDTLVFELLRKQDGLDGENVHLLRQGLPAGQIKWLIGRCRCFIGARTHSTIAAVSSGVPTIAIAYSLKARGIWRDIFGNEEYVLPIQELNARALREKWDMLQRNEPQLRQCLAAKQPSMIQGATENSKALRHLLRTRQKRTFT